MVNYVYYLIWTGYMRKKRKKSPEYKYHIRVRGLEEIPLFRDDEDKGHYKFLISKYKKIYGCKIYSYCIMNTHAHFFIDPKGYDISKFMHKVNLCYAQYYNKKYDRNGPVFMGRFESDPVCTYNYAIALSAYIHNNPKDIKGYRGREEYFYYSSYGIYAGMQEDNDNFVDTRYILGLMLCKNKEDARKKYFKLVKTQNLNSSIRNIIKCLSSGDMRIFDESSLA